MLIRKLLERLKHSQRIRINRWKILFEIWDDTSDRALVIKALLLGKKDPYVSTSYLEQKITSILSKDRPEVILDFQRLQFYESLKQQVEVSC